MGKELYKHIQNLPPVELARKRGKRQDTSTRDKNLLLKKVADVEEVAELLGFEIILKKKSENT